MRLIYFSSDYTTHDWRYLNKLSQQDGYSVYYLRLQKGLVELEKRPLPSGVNLINWSGGKKLVTSFWELIKLLPSLKNIIRQIKPEIIHCGPIPSCGFLLALTGFKQMVLMSWGSDLLFESERNFFSALVTKFTLKRAAGIVVDSETGKKKVYQFVKKYPKDRILVLPWGVDLQVFNPNRSSSLLREHLNWQDKLVLISTRSWEPIYGIDVVLKAFVEVLKKNSSVRLLLLGTGTLTNKVHHFIKENNLSSFVNIVGQVPQEELPDYYLASDIYLSASFSDGTSVSLLEAMACGLPVIVTDIPTNREWVENEVNGYLFPTGDFSSLSNILLTATKNMAYLKEMGRKNLEMVKRKADWNRNFQNLIYLYNRILNLKSHSKND